LLKIITKNWASALVVLWCLFFSTAASAIGPEEFNGGLDQSFSTGYSQTTFAEKFHSTAFEVPSEKTDNESWETWQFFKEFNFSTVYDNNLNAVRTGKVEDGILTSTPTVGVKRSGRHDFFLTAYDLTYVRYINSGKLNRFNHLIKSQRSYRFPKLKVDFYNSLKPSTAYAIGERTELTSAEATRVITYSDNAIGVIDYNLTSKTHLLYTHRYSIYYFPVISNSIRVNGFSSQTHAFNPRVSYQWTTKTNVYADYEFDTVDFFQRGIYSSQTNIIAEGINHRFSQKTTAKFELGYLWRDYSNPDVARSQGAYQFKLAISRRLAPKTWLTFWATRNLAEDLAGSTSTNVVNRMVYYYGTDLNWQISHHISLRNGVSIGVDHKDGYVTLIDPYNPKQSFTRQPENRNYECDISLNWNPRPFLTALLGYQYFKHEANFKNSNYEDHKVVFSFRYKF